MNFNENKVIEDFGKEWEAYNQKKLNNKELYKLFNNYFHIFPFNKIDKESIGFDMGCGSGRWARLIAPRVKELICIEPSKRAINEAKNNLSEFSNCQFLNYDVHSNPLKDNSQDFGYCLGVLHHIPETKQGLKKCVKKLKKGAPFLLYLYYRFDNKPFWFKTIWNLSDKLRNIISLFPFRLKVFVTFLIALFVYWPLARVALIFDKFSLKITNLPLSSYKDVSFYTMKTDSLDRFGTSLEKRFTKNEIIEMMTDAGLGDLHFSNKPPFWVAVGTKK